MAFFKDSKLVGKKIQSYDLSCKSMVMELSGNITLEVFIDESSGGPVIAYKIMDRPHLDCKLLPNGVIESYSFYVNLGNEVFLKEEWDNLKAKPVARLTPRGAEIEVGLSSIRFTSQQMLELNELMKFDRNEWIRKEQFELWTRSNH